MKIFIARQPIFDRKKDVYAYQLLYRNDTVNRALITDEGYATLKVIANSLLIGLKKLTSGKRAFIQFNRKLLLGKTPLLFPQDLLGVEVLESVEPDERILKACEMFKSSGYPLIFDELILKPEHEPFTLMADIVKINFRTTTASQRKNIIKKLNKIKSMKFLAEKVETPMDFEEASELGCHYFQGFFFRKPDLVTRNEMPGYKINYLQILKKIHQLVPDFGEIEEIIKRDVSLTYKLLRFINSASYGFKVTIRSIRHALNLLGKREVKKWLTIIVMSGIGRDKPSELMNAVIVRARFCELTAKHFKLHPHPSDGFLMGMFSMVDSFLDRPKLEILEELPLDDEIKDALLGREGVLLDVLNLVTSFEKAEWNDFFKNTEALGIDAEEVGNLYVESVEWAKFLV